MNENDICQWCKHDRSCHQDDTQLMIHCTTWLDYELGLVCKCPAFFEYKPIEEWCTDAVANKILEELKKMPEIEEKKSISFEKALDMIGKQVKAKVKCPDCAADLLICEYEDGYYLQFVKHNI